MFTVLDTNCSHYAEAGPRKHTYSEQIINVHEDVTECNIQQLYCGINVQGVEIKYITVTSVK